MTGLRTEQTPSSTSHLPPAPRETAASTDLWVSLSLVVALGVSAAAVALWPTGQREKTATPSVIPTTVSTTRDPLLDAPSTAPPKAQISPTRFTNPFDPSEVFEFPPGTTKSAARESVADVLLQRARERQTQTVSVKHARDHRSVSLGPTALGDAAVVADAVN